MSELAPKLMEIEVKPEKLILDPNNPRLITRDEDRYDGEADALDQMVATSKRMSAEKYKISELKNSIRQNGWLPVDLIFVKKYGNEDRYLVLEGNRRVTAIWDLQQDEDTSDSIREQIDKIKVMEIIDKVSDEKLKEKITYLLGVRHHGSLVKWSRFARAHNRYKRFLELSEMTEESFAWNSAIDIGQKIADALSIKLDEVKSHIKVYRAMEQIGNTESIKQSETQEGGIKDRYYSLCEEVLLSKDKHLNKYIQQDSNTFLLDNVSLERMINLCRFDQPKREDSPINNPQEWRKLINILKEVDETRKEEMLKDVEENARKPSEVWAERRAELVIPTWERWLDKVCLILKSITMESDTETNEAKDVINRLLKLVSKLDEKDK